MSEGHSEERPADGGDLPAEPEANPPPPAAESLRQRNSSRFAALGLLGALILLATGIVF